jgi:UDPglucose 6-dehydrogenase
MQRNVRAVVVGGLGVVGSATRKMLNIPHYWDARGSNITEDELHSSSYIFLCLPTPTVGGCCDVSALLYYFELLGSNHVYIIRSTVIPGTAQRLAQEFGVPVLSNPEFLTEALAEEECLQPDLIVLGADDEKERPLIWERFYSHIEFQHYMFTSTVMAEFIKYAVNTFYASKVVFANALYQCAEDLGLNYEAVKEALYARKWIGNNHLTVPWKGRFGADGKCLPKDLTAFATFTAHPFFQFMDRTNQQLLAQGK